MLGEGPTGTAISPQNVKPISRNPERAERASYVELAPDNDATGSIRKPVEFGGNGTDVSLNFVNVPVHEFVRVVFDEIIKVPVVVDSDLKGNVTVRTQAPVSRSTAMDLVRQALQASGASLAQTGSTYRVSAKSDGRGPRRFGDSVRIVPLRYISTDEAKNALSAFAQNGVEIAPGPGGRYIVLAGNGPDLDTVEQAMETLDVDQMKGLSFGLFPLKEAGASSVATELTQMFGRPNDPRAFKVMPIERMNAVLVVSTRPDLINQSRRWLTKLDGAGQDGRKIYVYPVQNRRAPDIAKIVSSLIDEESRKQNQDIANKTVAPQLTPVSGRSSRSQPVPSAPPIVAAPDITSSIPTNSDHKNDKQSGPRLAADVSTNSIVVTANQEEWRVIESALRRLDVMPPQVLIEATVAEVTLNNSLNHGVRWFLQQGNHTTALLGGTDSGALDTFGAGFSYSFGVPKARIVLHALEQVTDVAIVSSPALTVLDNQTARLQVGDQVPIATQSAVSVATTDAPIVNNIEYKDTGVILSVTPRVNASGLVVLDIVQEVSDVVPTTTSSINSPTIRQRRLNSSIATYSGMDVVLGGLISAARSKSDSGIPKAMDIPVLGNLFKSDARDDKARTELLIILRPTVMAKRSDIQGITNEIKRRMSDMVRSFRK